METNTNPPAAQAASENQITQESFPHFKLIKEEGLDIAKLPKEIIMRMNMWKASWVQYERTKSAKTLNTLKRQSVQIADMVQTQVVEKDAPEEAAASGASQSNSESQPQGSAEPVKDKEEPLNEEEQEEEEEEEEEQQEEETDEEDSEDDADVQASQEQQVLSILDARGKITHRELKKIMQQNVGEHVVCGSVILQNIFLTNDYQRVR